MVPPDDLWPDHLCGGSRLIFVAIYHKHVIKISTTGVSLCVSVFVCLSVCYHLAKMTRQEDQKHIAWPYILLYSLFLVVVLCSFSLEV